MKHLQQPALRRATILIIVLWILQQISGFNNVVFYMQIILIQAESEIIDTKVMVIYVSAASVFASILSTVLIDKCGRRLLLIVSSIGVTLALMGLGTHFLLIDMNIDVTKNLQWLPVVSMFLFGISFFGGLLSVPNTVLGELFPTNIKCIAACFASMAGALFSFFSTKAYQPMVNLIGQAYVFYIHAILTIIIVPYSILCMPETKGKTLHQIQEDLVNR